MPPHDLPTDIVDDEVRRRTVQRFAAQGIRLPTFAELADPATLAGSLDPWIGRVGPDDPHALNLYRVHWFNGPDRRARVAVPGHLVLPTALTGVRAPILVALGERFPMIGAHKVLAAYGCLVPRLVAGVFDPGRHRAVWPSTGNYCRGGVAISRILGCRGVAVLPEGMSRERFAWLEHWVADPADIIRTPGTESNVKEIYDKCKELAALPDHVILNQFAEFANHLVHWRVTGAALGHVFAAWAAEHGGGRLAAFVSATGSAGTIAAGDWLKDHFGARTVAVEALECPTLLRNGYGAHNIQGIGDKHVPLIHNVMDTDLVVGVSDAATDSLHAVFQSEVGRTYLAERRGVAPALLGSLASIGISGICNVLAAIKTARYLDLGPEDAVVTVATDGAAMYGSEIPRIVRERLGGRFDTVTAAEVVGQHLAGAGVDHVTELDKPGRDRLFNLGYFTWVEQQGVALADFEVRRQRAFWLGLRALVPIWDELIEGLNAEVAACRA
ncbi:MAG: pyridoxal-phosphate dependent enzyme [Deltaproteobacteria bacterium]|nr:pyridoxal-phosphate dependent enzyme [Deltaproteobacteria bacterium]